MSHAFASTYFTSSNKKILHLWIQRLPCTTAKKQHNDSNPTRILNISGNRGPNCERMNVRKVNWRYYRELLQRLVEAPCRGAGAMTVAQAAGMPTP